MIPVTEIRPSSVSWPSSDPAASDWGVDIAPRRTHPPLDRLRACTPRAYQGQQTAPHVRSLDGMVLARHRIGMPTDHAPGVLHRRASHRQGQRQGPVGMQQRSMGDASSRSTMQIVSVEAGRLAALGRSREVGHDPGGDLRHVELAGRRAERRPPPSARSAGLTSDDSVEGCAASQADSATRGVLGAPVGVHDRALGFAPPAGHVQGVGGELALHQVGVRRRRRAAAAEPAPVHPGQLLQPHQPLHASAPDAGAAPEPQLGVDPPDAVGAPRRRMHVADHVEQVGIGASGEQLPVDPR